MKKATITANEIVVNEEEPIKNVVSDALHQPVRLLEKPTTIKIMFVWQLFTPDPRAYKPSAPVIVPMGGQKIAIEIPLTSEFVDNASEIILGQIATDSTPIPEPVLTPAGMRHCIDVFEAAMANPDTGKPHNEFDEKPETKPSADKADWSDENDWDDDWDNPKTSKNTEPEDKKPVAWDDDETWD